MYSLRPLSFLTLAACTLVSALSYKPPNCSSLAHSTILSAYNASFISTTYFATGAYNLSGTLNKFSFCEASVSVKYGNNDTLQFALWLPDKEYSSRFMAVGNGGEAGTIVYSDMLEELNNGLGFAIAGGNAGHLASDNDAGVGATLGAPGVYQPFLHDGDQIQAWIHNAISLLTPASKALIHEFYGHKAKYSYFRGCSAGGAQGFSLAELYPGLFDGIIAGCPANGFTRLLMAFLWGAQHTNTKSTFLPDPLLDFIQAKVIEKCDTLDGVKDNLVENPLACHFDISSLACPVMAGALTGSVNNTNTCLTPAQISAAKALYQGPIRSDSHSPLFPGLALGSEAGWSLPQVSGALSNAFTVPLLQQLVYNNLSYDASTFNWASDVDLFDARASPLIDSINPNLSSFHSSGGKMIIYAGWADPNISPFWSLQHVESITQTTLGRKTTIAENEFVKLVMIPGGGHCGGNIAKYPYVPAVYGMSAAMVEWVEGGKEPDGIKSWGPTDGGNKTRKLCTWPKVAKLKKGGEVDDWESYFCG